MAILLTAQWLIWARQGDQTGTVVIGAKLQVIKVKAYVTRRMKNMDNAALSIRGLSKEYVRGTLEMGPDPAAQKFCEAVVAAVSNSKPPTKSKFFGLISG